MESINPKLLGVFGADLSLELLSLLVEKNIFTNKEAADLITLVAEKNEDLDKKTSTNANKEIATFARDMADAFLSRKN